MSLLKCPKCGEMFSDSYKTCPFCEEDEAFANGGKKPVNPGRRVHRQKSPSILGPTLVLVLVLVAGVLLYTLIGSGKSGDDRPDPPKNPTEDVDPNTPTVTLSLDQTALELTVGGTGKLTATGAEGITWTSGNAGVAAVGEDGTVTAVAAGTATISASAEGADPVTCTVTVKEAPKKDLVLRSIYQSEGTALEQFSMSVGAPAVPMTVDGTDSTVKWSTEDSSIATINSDGEVTAVKSGKTMVVAVVDGQTLKCEVIVGCPQLNPQEPPPTGGGSFLRPCRSHRVCLPQEAKKQDDFRWRRVRQRKYLSGCQCGICGPSAHKLCTQQTASPMPENPMDFQA